MRINIALGIIVVLASLLQGCGKKGPLTPPVPETHKTEIQIPSLQKQTPQQPAAPATQP